ncbi:hypothetical protein PG996_004403 [Apiospora saccharicola]|uniref:Uncharacterized protein n=1 Tax=Apiospora saccharicola TaxID=335842 RepID=A0ABR1W443_9PEZI
MTELSVTEWNKLYTQQKIAIRKLFDEYDRRIQYAARRFDILSIVFSSWDASQKPPVPVVSHPKLDVFSSLFAPSNNHEASGSKRARSPDSEDDAQRPRKKKKNQSNNDSDQDPPEDMEALAQHIMAREASIAEHYKKQNKDIVIFLVRKYLYNVSRIEPWSPEDDGKDRVFISDITTPKAGGDSLDQCIGVLNELKSAYETHKRNKW